METQQIIEQALKLDPAERLAVIDKLNESLDQPDPEIERLWLEEAQRRLADHDAGRSESYSMKEVFGKD